MFVTDEDGTEELFDVVAFLLGFFCFTTDVEGDGTALVAIGADDATTGCCATIGGAVVVGTEGGGVATVDDRDDVLFLDVEAFFFDDEGLIFSFVSSVADFVFLAIFLLLHRCSRH